MASLAEVAYILVLASVLSCDRPQSHQPKMSNEKNMRFSDIFQFQLNFTVHSPKPPRTK